VLVWLAWVAGMLVAASAAAQAPASSDPSSNSRPGEKPREDPTGGAYTMPTLLFVPAGAVPAWTVRAITCLAVQGPTAAGRQVGGLGEVLASARF